MDRFVVLIIGVTIAITFFFSFNSFAPRAYALTASDMQEIEIFQSDLAKAQGRADLFWFALKKIKANPSNYKQILQSVNIWEKL
jgi:hypothetical protein